MESTLHFLGVVIYGLPFVLTIACVAETGHRMFGGDRITWMTWMTLGALAVLQVACHHNPCISGAEIGINGSRSDGQQALGTERWDTDDVTVGGHATLYIDTTGACNAPQ